jgi:hypothetical protein
VVDARLYEQCCIVYEAMAAESKVTLLAEAIDEVSHPIRLYTGHTTYLIEQLGYNISHYTPIMRRLQTMGCIKQLQRGGRGIPSEWQIVKPPTERAFTRSGQRWLHDRARIDALERRVLLLEQALDEQQAS